jgi:hypothetical protein
LGSGKGDVMRKGVILGFRVLMEEVEKEKRMKSRE